MSEKRKLSCPVCKNVYWAEIVGLPDGSTEGSIIPYTCPVCGNKESKVEE